MTSTTAALWDSLEQKHDWQLIAVLGDSYGDDGDEIAQEFCQWVVTKERSPIYAKLTAANSLGWHWNMNSGTGPSALGNKADGKLLEAMLEKISSREFWSGSTTIRRAYEFLLEAWRLLSDEQRQAYWDWKP